MQPLERQMPLNPEEEFSDVVPVAQLPPEVHVGVSGE